MSRKKKAETQAVAPEKTLMEKIFEATNKDTTSVLSLEKYGLPGEQLTVRRRLSPVEATAMANDIATACVDMETGIYMPEMFDLTGRMDVLAYYAGMTDMPGDPAVIDAVVNCTDIYEDVRKLIDNSQLYSIRDCAEDRVAHMLRMLEATGAETSLKLIGKADEMIRSSEKMIKKLSEVDFSVLEKIAPETFAGIEAPAPADPMPEGRVVGFDLSPVMTNE